MVHLSCCLCSSWARQNVGNTAVQEKIMRKWIGEEPQITINKLRERIISELGLNISRSSGHRIMKGLESSYITGRSKHYKQNTAALPEAKKIY